MYRHQIKVHLLNLNILSLFSLKKKKKIDLYILTPLYKGEAKD